MADTDVYQPDAAGSAELADAKNKTSQAADDLKAQETKAESPKSKSAQAPASSPASGSGPMSAAKNALKSSPVVQGVTKVLGAFKKGGTVPETGNYKLHKNEEVLPNNGRASAYRRVFKARGEAGKHKFSSK